MNIRFQSVFLQNLHFFYKTCIFKILGKKKEKKKSIEYERNRQLQKPGG